MPITEQTITTVVITEVPLSGTTFDSVSIGLSSDEIRDKIFEIISRKPGVRICDVCKACCGSRNNITYHIHQLRRQNKIKFVKDGKYTRLYHPGVNLNRVPKFSSRTQEKIFKILRTNGRMTQDEISDKTGISQQLVSYYLKKFLNGKCILIYKNNGRKKYGLKQIYKQCNHK